jgi:predicted transporter
MPSMCDVQQKWKSGGIGQQLSKRSVLASQIPCTPCIRAYWVVGVIEKAAKTKSHDIIIEYYLFLGL